jgi:hypothetical protein
MADQYISTYLTHWTGKDKPPEQGMANIRSILSNHQLWLNDCLHITIDYHTNARTRMVCFTDIPLPFAAPHCQQYGRFGICFIKRAIRNYGANPAFYFTHSINRDAKRLHRFLYELGYDNDACPPDVLDSLSRVLAFAKVFSDDEEDGLDTYYYEREWRLVEKNLQYIETGDPTPGKMALQEIGGEERCCFQFREEDVAFIVVPADYSKEAEELVRDKAYGWRCFSDIVPMG